jgi:hypothetical protein
VDAKGFKITKKEVRGRVLVTCSEHGKLAVHGGDFPWTAAQVTERTHTRDVHRVPVTL